MSEPGTWGACGSRAGREGLERYRAVRARTEALAAPLSPEDAVVQSMPDASPAKWHLAHTTWFFETFLLGPAIPGFQVFDPAYAFLFNSYYEALGPRQERPRRGLLTRPPLEEVLRYRRAVDAAVAGAWAALPPGLAELGLRHEEQHQELLLTDLLHLLHQNPLRPAYRPQADPPRPPARALGWLAHSGGLVELGHGGPGFAFDHEGPRHRVHLAPFRLGDRCVTCGEFLAFLEDGGYRRPELWLAEGWDRVREEGWTAPLYWEREGEGWRVFTLAGLRPLDPEAPLAHVSHFEADAYARWAGFRLPTEGEWEVLAREDGGAPEPRQWTGEVWQWTASPFVAYPGFRPHPGPAGEYNGKFMSGQMVLRGGSRFTAPGHAAPTTRNFFPPRARWQAAGLRLAGDL
jgi:ergothioneine biosynthesis protein EgtB